MDFAGEASAICKFGIGKCTYPGKCQQDCIDKGFYFGGDCETTKKGLICCCIRGLSSSIHHPQTTNWTTL